MVDQYIDAHAGTQNLFDIGKPESDVKVVCPKLKTNAVSAKLAALRLCIPIYLALLQCRLARPPAKAKVHFYCSWQSDQLLGATTLQPLTGQPLQ